MENSSESAVIYPNHNLRLKYRIILDMTYWSNDNEIAWFVFRKEAHREFRRLYHLEEKRRQQLLNRHEFEIDEQRQEFRRKREELIKKYDFELQTMEQKQKIEIERESVLLANEYNKKTKQIRMGLFKYSFLKKKN